MPRFTDEQIRQMAREMFPFDDDVEMDHNAQVSRVDGGDHGAWVQAWIWVSFPETEDA